MPVCPPMRARSNAPLFSLYLHLLNCLTWNNLTSVRHWYFSTWSWMQQENVYATKAGAGQTTWKLSHHTWQDSILKLIAQKNA